MIELPEALTLSRQLQSAVAGKTVAAVLPPTRPHRFCFFDGDPAAYDAALRGRSVVSAEGFGIFVELLFSEGKRLCLNDGVNVRLVPRPRTPGDYQLLLCFEDGDALVFTVAMYGSILLHEGGLDNPYYEKSRRAISPFSPEFAAHFCSVLAESRPTLSAKAFLATEQRFPGIGNGTLQDILFAARIHPKRKIASLTEDERERLAACTASVLGEMTRLGGRDTEKDLFGNPGGYQTRMSKRTLAGGGPACGGPACGGPITKEAYLGGAVYYCPRCQGL